MRRVSAIKQIWFFFFFQYAWLRMQCRISAPSLLFQSCDILLPVAFFESHRENTLSLSNSFSLTCERGEAIYRYYKLRFCRITLWATGSMAGFIPFFGGRKWDPILVKKSSKSSLFNSFTGWQWFCFHCLKILSMHLNSSQKENLNSWSLIENFIWPRFRAPKQTTT